METPRYLYSVVFRMKGSCNSLISSGSISLAFTSEVQKRRASFSLSSDLKPVCCSLASLLNNLYHVIIFNDRLDVLICNMQDCVVRIFQDSQMLNYIHNIIDQ